MGLIWIIFRAYSEIFGAQMNLTDLKCIVSKHWKRCRLETNSKFKKWNAIVSKHSFEIRNEMSRLETFFGTKPCVINRLFQNFTLHFRPHFTVSKPSFSIRVTVEYFEYTYFVTNRKCFQFTFSKRHVIVFCLNSLLSIIYRL